VVTDGRSARCIAGRGKRQLRITVRVIRCAVAAAKKYNLDQCEFPHPDLDFTCLCRNWRSVAVTEESLSGFETRIGGELLAAMLAAEGVTHVFGIVDGTYLGLYAAFEKFGIRLVSPRHETSAAHMAGAYARSTGRLGVCMASNGPGVANILPGVAVESGEGNRVLLITSAAAPGSPTRSGAALFSTSTRWA
jgi:hypothetical protein